ncbi:SDR family oxidoreductase [Pseudomonas luteola]|uniref:SDR family NAD(P)-dependent oxidoreductase n=1 Tax=Pseudomonas TaxID=286 RepID=UPI001EF412C6|nr:MULTISPECIES: SDR family oxidoreductase [Pseudomonas]MCG7374130.1 SDR family oxidoreductase [Pseudomonas luteola]
MGRFAGKKVLITGGTRGIGLVGAQRIIEEGGQVILTGRNREYVAQAAKRLPVGSLAILNDATDASAPARLVEAVLQWGRLDGLWLNAGYAQVEPLEAITADSFDRMMAANVRGPLLQLAALSSLINPFAAVLVTSSSSAYEGSALTSLYAATKGALISMSRCWAAALAERNIRVNVLMPGPIETSFRSFMDESTRQKFEEGVLKQVPLARIGTPEEAAAVALFLLSSESSYVTGSQYAVDGGLLMR